MNRALLLQHFDRISEAPDSIPRLRKFILDLAVRGKLVEQDPHDEPAGELLKRIQAEKAHYEKKPKHFTPITREEVSFDLPLGWEWVRIRQITTDRGQTVPKNEFTYIDVTAINKERGCIGELTVLSAEDAPSRARKIVHKGDVIYSCVRPYLLNIAIIDTDITPLPIASTAFAVMNGFGLTLPQYLWTVLRSPFLIESVEDRMRGQAYPAINDSDFSVLPFPLPPLAEQNRIVAKVDELMALCDQLEAERNKREARRDRLVASSLNRISTAPAEEAKDATRFHLNHLPRLTTRTEHIKQLRQTILNLAVRGRLVPQDPNDEPASELIKRNLDWRNDAIKKKQIRTPKKSLEKVKANEAPYLRPNNWQWSRLGEIIYIQSGGGLTAANMKDGEIPVFGGNGVNGYHDAYNVDEPTIVIGRVGYYCGSIHLTPIKAWVTDNAFITHYCQKALYQDFLLLLLKGTNLKERENATAQPVISGSKIYPLVVGLPPFAEQHRIVAKVDELMALCDQLEAQLTTTEADSRRLLEAVLRDALDTSKMLN